MRVRLTARFKMTIQFNLKQCIAVFFIGFFLQILEGLDLGHIGVVLLNLLSLFYIIKAISINYIIFLIQNPRSFKQELIGNYINFVDFVLTYGRVPDIFYNINLPLGLVICRQFTDFFNITYIIYRLFILFLGPLVWCVIMFIILYGYYCLCLLYPFFGSSFLKFVKDNASEKILKKLGLKK